MKRLKTHEISKYNISFQGGPTTAVQHRVIIFLYNEDKKKIASLCFDDPSVEPKVDSIIRNRKDEIEEIKMHLPVSMYYDVLDMLRNEKPIYISFLDSPPKAYLHTSWEPVGEGEIELQ